MAVAFAEVVSNGEPEDRSEEFTRTFVATVEHSDRSDELIELYERVH